jgi:hypothetical protein
VEVSFRTIRLCQGANYLPDVAVGLVADLDSAELAAGLAEDAGVSSQISPWGHPPSLRHIVLGLSGPYHLVHPLAYRRIVEPSEPGVPLQPAVVADVALSAAVVATVGAGDSRL